MENEKVYKYMKVGSDVSDITNIVNGRPWYGQWLWAWEKIRPYIKGNGIDCGCGMTPIPGARPVEPNEVFGAGFKDVIKSVSENLDKVIPENNLDFVFSSHSLEHTEDWKKCVRNFVYVLKEKGVLILYIPHPAKDSWRADGHRTDHKYNFSFDKLYDEVKEDIDLIYGTNIDDGHGALLFIGRKIPKGRLQWETETSDIDLKLLREYEETHT